MACDRVLKASLFVNPYSVLLLFIGRRPIALAGLAHEVDGRLDLLRDEPLKENAIVRKRLSVQTFLLKSQLLKWI